MTPQPYPRPFGPFVLLQPIGHGGMSEVDLARQAISEANFVRFIVIKRIHDRHMGNEQFVRMFQDEARINAELQHENIAQVYAFGRTKGEYYLAMEYVPGVDLRELQLHLQEAKKSIPIRIALRIVHDVLAGLEYAHGRVDTYGRPMNIVHRDVNPRNIMLSIRGEVKLIDFGVAKADTKNEQTQEHALKGKYSYMAPEQIDSTDNLDGRVDVFALGLVLHELLTGSRPFAMMNEVQTFHRILSGKIPAPKTIEGHPQPDLVLQIHQTALQVDRDNRYSGAQEMRQAILEAAKPLGGLPSSEEMSLFLREAMPSQTEAIGQRLQKYGRMDLTGYYRRPGHRGETLVRATNVTETFEIKPRAQTESHPNHTAAANISQDVTIADPENSAPTGWVKGKNGIPKPLLIGASLLLIMGYLLVLGAGFLLWDLLQANESASQVDSTVDE